VDEQEHPASPAVPAPGATTPVAGPQGRDRRAEGVREALTSRGAGWAAAAILAGTVVGLSVTMATASSPTVLVQPEGAAGAQRLRVALPAGLPVRIGAASQAAAGTRIAVPARTGAQAPVRLRVRVPGAQVRVAPGQPGPARLLLPAAAQVQLTPGRPGPLRVRFQVPARLRIQVRGGVPSPAQVLVPARLPAAVAIPGTPGGALRVVRPGEFLPVRPPAQARIRIRFQRGVPVSPVLVPGQARLRLQFPARVQVSRPLPAPPAW